MDYTHTNHLHGTNHRITDPNGMRDEVNWEHHIHSLEIQAYSSMLKAFIAQSELLTWGKEELLTELRKELNVADSEHGEILTKINSDASIRWIREQRKMASHSQAQDYYIKDNTPGCPSASIGNSTMRLKTHAHDQDYIKANTPGCPSASTGNSIIRLKAPSSAAFYPQNNISRSQAPLSSIHIPASMPPKFNDNLLTAEFVHGNAERPKEMLNYDVQLPPIGRGSVPKQNYQFKQHFHPSESLMLNNRSDLIQIRATNRVIQDVEKILFSREKPGPADIERAKQILNEQERAILEALSKLADVLEGGSDRFLNSLFL